MAEQNAGQSQQAIRFCRQYAHGWLTQADARSGLIPRNLTGDLFWNAKDSAADNYPFIVLTAYVTDDYYLKQAAQAILAQEQKLTSRVDSLPDDFLFSTQNFRLEKPDLDSVIFGAAEYAKDGLLPVSEWLGPSPWQDRLQQLIRDIFKQASYNTPAGKLPSQNIELNGDLLQAASRLYWMTGDDDFKNWAFILADYYLLHENLLEREALVLRDHGSEIIGGLSEACLLAWQEDPSRWRSYRSKMRNLIDRILEVGSNPDGLLYNAINPKSGQVINRGLADTWGYVYNAILTISLAESEPRYRDAAGRALSNIAKYQSYDWEGGSADGLADSAESAINLLNRIPIDSAFGWVGQTMNSIFAKQGPDGIIEGWHGDGNSARTAIMYALWKTQGITAAPWRDDLRLGAALRPDGVVLVYLAGDRPWSGWLRFDRPRHRDRMHLPMDYPRINQFPEWFTASATARYEIKLEEAAPLVVEGTSLYDYPLTLEPGKPLRLAVKRHEEPAGFKLRAMKYTSRLAAAAFSWQRQLRAKLRELLKLDDLVRMKIPLHSRILSTEERPAYVLQEVEFSSTPGRRIKAMVTIPRGGEPPYSAVVCIHGHGGTRRIVYDASTVYKGFGAVLAETGFVTIAVDVGQHEVYEPGRTLMGERLWDLIRCVDYCETLEAVKRKAIGCAGLSLGGEMAMWLAAMDERVAACASSGFLTVMDQMEHDHCLCWKFE
ncbi:MAG: alpha/beta fold hydrolase, partial [Acidobacteriota bacterium]